MNSKLKGRNLNNRRFWRTTGVRRGMLRLEYTRKYSILFGSEMVAE